LNSIRAAINGVPLRHQVRHSAPDAHFSGLTPLKILVVEDNVVNQKLVISLLNKWHHSATIAATGLIALRRYEQEQFDLILMDMQMPEMGGIEATQRIRAMEASHPERRHTPIIAMTANAMPGDWERCLAAGMDHYLSKPIKATQLQNLLRQYQKAIPVTSTTKDIMMNANSFDYSQALQSADQEIIQIIAQSFLDAYEGYVKEIADAIATQDGELLHRSSHTMKGVVSNFCAFPIETLAEKLEKKGKGLQFDGAEELLSEMRNELTMFTTALKQLMAEKS